MLFKCTPIFVTTIKLKSHCLDFLILMLLDIFRNTKDKILILRFNV